MSSHPLKGPLRKPLVINLSWISYTSGAHRDSLPFLKAGLGRAGPFHEVEIAVIEQPFNRAVDAAHRNVRGGRDDLCVIRILAPTEAK